MKIPSYLVLITLLLATTSTGCKTPRATYAPSERHIPADTLSRAINAVVRITDRHTGSFGTGYFFWKYDVDNRYLVLTCSHVITTDPLRDLDPSRLYAVHSPFTSTSVASFEFAIHDPIRDIAILRTEPINADLPILNIFDDQNLDRQRKTSPLLFVAGFPLGIHTVLPTTTEERNWRKLVTEDFWILNDTSFPGSSGSPVITYDGIVVGIVQARDPCSNRAKCLGLTGMDSFFAEIPH